MSSTVQIHRFHGLRAVGAYALLAVAATLAHELAGARRDGAGAAVITPVAVAPVVDAPPRATSLVTAAPVDPPPPAASPPASAPAFDREAAWREARRGITRVDHTHDRVDRTTLDAVLASPQTLIGAARIMPVLRCPGPDGLRLYALRPASPLAALGLRNGDTLLTLDGVELVDHESPFATYQATRARARHQLTVRRRGALVRLHYTIVRR